jgi:fatty acid desaturase
MSSMPWVNTVCTYLGSFHIQYHLWAIQHVVGHHTHTNVMHRDPDLHHFTHETDDEKYVPGYRSHRSQDVLPKYKNQWKFAVFFQCFATTIAIAVLNVPLYIEKRAMMTTAIPERFIKHIKFDRGLLVVGIAIFCYYHGIGRGILTIFLSYCVHGALFNIFSQMSHINEHSMVATDAYRKTHKLEKNEWAVHQMLTANDYSCDSWMWCALSINLNQQIMHHLFPSIHPCHYPALRHVLIPVAAKHGIDYEARSSSTFFQALWAYLTWLHQMNQLKKGWGSTVFLFLGMGLSSGLLLALSAYFF